MVAEEVLHHLEPLLGAVRTVEAAVGLLLGVRQEMMSQAGRPAEGLVAGPAGVGPGAAVLPLVGLQDEARLEGLAALLTDEGAGVAVLRGAVGAQSVRPVGAVGTVAARVSLLPWKAVHYGLMERRRISIWLDERASNASQNLTNPVQTLTLKKMCYWFYLTSKRLNSQHYISWCNYSYLSH